MSKEMSTEMSKKIYERPELIICGTLQELTRGTTGNQVDLLSGQLILNPAP